MPDAPILSADGGCDLQEGQAGRRGLRRSFQRTARASERACRASSAPARHRGHQDPRDGLRRRRQAMAAEGNGPRARRLLPLSALDRRWRRVRAATPLLHLQGKPQGAARRATQRSLPTCRTRFARHSSTPLRSRHRRPATPLTYWMAGASHSPTLVVLGADESAAALSFRNLARVAVLQPENVGVADLLGAASLLVSEAALADLTARAEAPSKESA